MKKTRKVLSDLENLMEKWTFFVCQDFKLLLQMLQTRLKSLSKQKVLVKIALCSWMKDNKVRSKLVGTPGRMNGYRHS